LELKFYYPSLNLGCVFPQEKSQAPIIGGFLHFTLIPGRIFNLPYWRFLIPSQIPGKIFNPLYWRFLIFYLKCFFCLRSQHLLCVWDKSPVIPTQPPGCPNHQSSTRVSYLGRCTELTWSSVLLAWTGPFSCIANWLLIWNSLLVTELADSPSLRPFQQDGWMHLPWGGCLHGSLGDVKTPSRPPCC
jgi:hypothetical protein